VTEPHDPLRRFTKAGEASADAALAALAQPTATTPDGVAEVVAAAIKDVDLDGPDDQPMQVPVNPRVAAFFDIDNTIMRGASIFQLARGAYARKLLSRGDLVGFAVDQLKFLSEGTEDMDVMVEATEAALSFAKGRTVAEIEQLGAEIYDDGIRGKIWPGTIALAQRHLAAGERVWLVSATPVELSRVIAERLGFTGAMGTISEIVDGVYTGKLVGHPLHGVAKAAALRALAAREGLDLSQCYAYSDSNNDLPMLTEVGRAIAVNPDSQLRQAAVENRWPIYDFRGRRLWVRYKLPGLIAGSVAAGAVVGSAATALALRSRR
jgi:HAD superfamily hydrolase (TIGR01490 family)